MILCDSDIRSAVQDGTLGISPYDDEMVQPASYDLKIGEDAATVPEDGEAVRNLREEGFMVIQAFTPAVVWTREELRLPLDIAGRFGLKSSLSRRGIYASVGPQIDPGFKGRLSVSLFNLTPSPIAMNYEDQFLTLELHRLERAASRGYEGKYQNRKTFSAKDIERSEERRVGKERRSR